MKRTLPILAIAAFVLTACTTLGPPNEQPAVPVPETWREGPATNESFANVEWFQVYDDPVLQQLIRESLGNNRDLRIAVERVVEARARYGVSRADLYPQVGASATGGYYDARDTGIKENDQLWSVGVDASWEVDLFGRVRSGNQVALANFLATEEAQRAATMTVVYAVARAYFELRDLDQELDITRRTLEDRKKYVDLVQALFEGGVRSEIDYRQAEGEYYNIEISLKDLERFVVTKENELSFLVGRNPGPIERGRPIDQQNLGASVPAGIPSTLLERRPDILEAEQVLYAANGEIGVAKALLFPRISLTAGLGGVSDDLGQVFSSTNLVSNLLANVFQPIFEGGRLRRNVEVTESQQRQALSNYQQVVLNAFRETEDSLISYQKTVEQSASYNARVNALRIVLRLTEAAYEGGVTDYLRVLDAQRSLYDAELTAVQNYRDQLVSLATLYRALGGGWSEPAAPAESTSTVE